MRRYAGIGLPELMIGLLLSSLILIALLQHFIVIKQQYHTLEVQLEAASETQWVIDLLRHSIRQSGFTPCLRIDRLVARDHRQSARRLQGIDIKDGLQSAYMSPYFDEVIEIKNPSQLLTTATQLIRLDYPLLIADCYHAEVVTVKAVKSDANQQTIILNTPLWFTYQNPTFLGVWIEERFWVQNNRLFYRYHHTDELTNAFQTMSVEMNQLVVGVTLKQTDGKILHIMTRMRSK